MRKASSTCGSALGDAHHAERQRRHEGQALGAEQRLGVARRKGETASAGIGATAHLQDAGDSLVLQPFPGVGLVYAGVPQARPP